MPNSIGDGHTQTLSVHAHTPAAWTDRCTNYLIRLARLWQLQPYSECYGMEGGRQSMAGFKFSTGLINYLEFQFVWYWHLVTNSIAFLWLNVYVTVYLSALV